MKRGLDHTSVRDAAVVRSRSLADAVASRFSDDTADCTDARDLLTFAAVSAAADVAASVAAAVQQPRLQSAPQPQSHPLNHSQPQSQLQSSPQPQLQLRIQPSVAAAVPSAAPGVALTSTDAIIPIVALLREGSTDFIKFAAVVALQRLAHTEEIKVVIFEAGVVAPLIVLLVESTIDWIQLAAADLLLAIGLEHRQLGAIGGVIAIAPLIAVLRGGSCSSGGSNDRVRLAAATALAHLATDGYNRVTLIHADAVAILVALLMNDMVDAVTKDVVISALVSISAIDFNTIALAGAAFARAGAFAPLVAWLQLGSTAAASALRNLSAWPLNRVAIAEAGAFTPLLVLLKHEQNQGRHGTVAADALRNLAEGILQVTDERFVVDGDMSGDDDLRHLVGAG